MKRRTMNDRMVSVYLGFLSLLGLVWIRCAWLQVVGGQSLARVAQSQHWTSGPLIAERGTIYDQSGRVLAMSLRLPSVYANPRQMTDKSAVAAVVSDALDRDEGRIISQLQRNKGFVWLARQVDPGLTGGLRSLRRRGVAMIEEPKRVYPHGQLAGHVLGFTDVDERGLEGLEAEFNGALRGRDGWRSTLRDARGQLLVGPWTTETPPQAGHDLMLTLDAGVQAIAEEALAWGVKQFRAKGGSVVVMDPETGGVLAMATRPTFDPNHPARVDAAHRRNRAVTDLMEPGSVFKIVAAAALLEERLATPADRVYCEEGSYRTVASHILHDHTPHGWLTFHEVIQYSSNIGTAKMAQRLTPDTLYRYIRDFGFGRRTGIELPGEINGMIAKPSRWSKLSPFIIPIGQEVGVTPVQMAGMVAVIANGGFRVKPHLVARIQTADGQTIRDDRHMTRTRLLHPDTVDSLTRMLTSVVESGTGQLAAIKGLTVAGKTGTAQKIELSGRYSHSRYIASFVGWGPVPDSHGMTPARPVVVSVSIDEPRPLYFGGVVAAPVFKRVIQQLVGYWTSATDTSRPDSSWL